MSTPTRKPYLSDEEVNGWIQEDGSTSCQLAMTAQEVRDKYEAHLAEREALIQRVVDHWDKWQGKGCIEADMEFDDIVTDMNKAGFKSTSSSDKLRNPE